MEEILCGIDWASDHHDVVLIDAQGRKLGRRRISDTAAGLGELTAMFAAHGGGPGTVKIAIETERGLLVAALRTAGYEIYPVNPKAVDRYRDRHHLARGKSDAGGALVLAHILRTGAHLHRPAPADGGRARAIGRQRRGPGDRGTGPRPPGPGVEPPARGEPAALAAGPVLPSRAGGLR